MGVDDPKCGPMVPLVEGHAVPEVGRTEYPKDVGMWTQREGTWRPRGVRCMILKWTHVDPQQGKLFLLTVEIPQREGL